MHCASIKRRISLCSVRFTHHRYLFIYSRLCLLPIHKHDTCCAHHVISSTHIWCSLREKFGLVPVYFVLHAVFILLSGQRFGGHVKDFSFKKRARPFAYNGEANTAVSYDTPDFFRARHTQVRTCSIHTGPLCTWGLPVFGVVVQFRSLI